MIAAALAGGTAPRQLVSELLTPPGAASKVAAFLTCLRAVLSGDRDPALLADPALDYVELILLLETLSSPGLPGEA